MQIMDNLRLLGIDVGSVNVKAALLDQGRGIVDSWILPCEGEPARAVSRIVQGIGLIDSMERIRVAITGCGKEIFGELPEIPVENEIISTAKGVSLICPDVKEIIEVGAQSTKWIRMNSDGSVSDYSTNSVCAAGSGSFLEQQAMRLQISVEELGELAGNAKKGATVAGRCSVFAKSDMIHLQQKGTPLEEIAYGLCLAVARNFLATVLRGRSLEAPVAFLGGGAENPGLVRAFREILESDPKSFFVPEHFRFAAAAGAPHVMSRSGKLLSKSDLEQSLEALFTKPVTAYFAKRLPPLVRSNSATSLGEPKGERGSDQGLFLGVDVGSVSTNLVLVTPEREVIDTVYLATKGRPVDVLREGLQQIRQRHGDGLKVLRVGATGSGRYLAARLLGADLVKNEITAQLTSSIEYCPGVDTVLEIGGQDSKFISAESGQIGDFTMNKLCAAGTGSFLEEQAESLGIDIVEDFAGHAFRSSAPIDLGSRCTVFMDTELVNARQIGMSLEDITAGLAYSIARNYLEKVVGNRPLGKNIIFQGGVASNQAVVSAFEALLGRKVEVHPYNRVSGAIGAALLAASEYALAPSESGFKGWDSCSDYSVRSFECDLCANRCEVNQYTAGGSTVFFGDVCERYSGAEEPSPSREIFPDLFQAREDLIRRDLNFSAGKNTRGVIGLPRAGVLLDTIPMWREFFRQLGFEVKLSSPSSPDLFAAGLKSLPVETCLPIKLVFGHVEDLLGKNVDYLFLPSLRQLPPRVSGSEDSLPCIYGEYLPFMMNKSKGRFLCPRLDLDTDIESLADGLGSVGIELGVPRSEIVRALAAALEKQKEFAGQMQIWGREVLETGAEKIFVVLGRPYTIYDPYHNLNLARHLQKFQSPVIPMDFLELTRVELEPEWNDLVWKYGRDNIRAAKVISKQPNLFPIVVSSYGCGPDGFISRHLEEFFKDRPSLFLEFDEHRGEAGLITRLEAFADKVEAHQLRRNRLSTSPAVFRSTRSVLPKNKKIFIPHIGEHSYAFSGALQAAGYDARVLPPPDGEAQRLGQKLSSGRECHPWTLMAGDLGRLSGSGLAGDGDVFFFPTINHFSCLLSQFASGHQKALQQLDGPGIRVVALPMSDIFKTIGLSRSVKLYQGLLAIDLLSKLVCGIRPYEIHPGETDRIQKENLEEIERGMVSRNLSSALEKCLGRLDGVEVELSGSRPKIGVAGDIYTRINPFSNGNLFQELEAMGCEVWSSPFMVDNIDFSIESDMAEAKGFHNKALRWIIRATRDISNARVLSHFPRLPSNLVEPSFEQALDLAGPYIGADAAFMVTLNIAKIVDFARKGAHGVINAMALNCMVGTLSASVMRRIREDHDNIPMISMVYGEVTGRAHISKLEAFVHQVKTRAAS